MRFTALESMRARGAASRPHVAVPRCVRQDKMTIANTPSPRTPPPHPLTRQCRYNGPPGPLPDFNNFSPFSSYGSLLNVSRDALSATNRQPHPPQGEIRTICEKQLIHDTPLIHSRSLTIVYGRQVKTSGCRDCTSSLLVSNIGADH